jgi:hypothetical protein
MNSNCRFVLDADRYIVDTLSSANDLQCWVDEGEPEDEKYLRERVLTVRLHALTNKLIGPIPKLPNEKEY